MPEIPRCQHYAVVSAGEMPLVDVLIRNSVPKATAFALPCSDVHALVANIARATWLARTDQHLLTVEYPPVEQVLGQHRWWHGRFPLLVWSVSLLALAAALALICSPIWRTFT